MFRTVGDRGLCCLTVHSPHAASPTSCAVRRLDGRTGPVVEDPAEYGRTRSEWLRVVECGPGGHAQAVSIQGRCGAPGGDGPCAEDARAVAWPCARRRAGSQSPARVIAERLPRAPSAEHRQRPFARSQPSGDTGLEAQRCGRPFAERSLNLLLRSEAIGRPERCVTATSVQGDCMDSSRRLGPREGRGVRSWRARSRQVESGRQAFARFPARRIPKDLRP